MAAHPPSNGFGGSVPSWSTYAAMWSGHAAGENDPVLTSYVEQLAGALKVLNDEVRTVESRQVTLDRRLAELGGLVQGMQEEQMQQGGKQQAATVGAHRALTTAVEMRRHMEQEDELKECLNGLTTGRANQLEQCCQQHGQWLLELSAEVTALRQAQGGRGSNAIAPRGGSCTQLAISSGGGVGPLSDWAARMSALEQKTQMIAVGARRALHTALVVHQQIQSNDHNNQWEKCLDSLPVAELEQTTTRRFTEQEARLDRLVQMVDGLTDRFLLQQSGDSGRFEELSTRTEDLENSLFSLSSEVRNIPVLQVRELIQVALEAFEARIDRHFNEIGLRLDALQDARDQQRLTIRQLAQQHPELASKVDQLWQQCQFYFPRVKEHDVHFSFFRSSFENHKQSMLDYADSMDHREQRYAAARGMSQSRTSSPAPPNGEDLSTPAVPSFPARGGGGGGGLFSSAGATAEPRTAQASAAGEDQQGSNGRSWMLAQVMERLHGGRDDGRAPVTPPGATEHGPLGPAPGGFDG